MSSETTEEEAHTSHCVVCHKTFESAGTLADAIRRAHGIEAPPDPSAGVGVCSFRCFATWFARRMRGEVE